MFEHLPCYAGDPILGLLERFHQDPRPEKINLGIGVYYDEQGNVPALQCVELAAQQYLSANEPCLYLPMEGDITYREAVADLLFADTVDQAEYRLATIQTLGGSGALKIGADFLANAYPTAKVWIGRPTWENHVAIFEGAGFNVCWYSHFNNWRAGFDVEPIVSALRDSSAGDIVLLHACCHNPTGIQPSKQQWGQLLDAIQRHKLIPFIDMAYQGFGDGLDEDAWLIKECSRRGIVFLVASSFSKNFSLYGERLGALCSHVAASSHEQVMGQLKLCVRRNYSSPPRFGAGLVGRVLKDPNARAQWSAELGSMRQRVKAMRSELANRLESHSYIAQQQGLFAYLNVSPQQVHLLRERHAVYMLDSGRLCLAGVNDFNVVRISEAINTIGRHWGW